MRQFIILIALLFCSLNIFAETVYKTVDANGNIVYTDRAPTTGKVSTLNYESAPFSPEPESVIRYRQELQKGIDKTMARAAMRENPNSITLFTTSWCTYSKQAKQYLESHNIRFREYNIETAEGAKALVETGTTRKGVPLLIAGTKQLRGYSQASYDNFFKN
ncbi:glutaredoxin domain-containing protein [Chitinibacter sp. S2-10]|uniref:glutaredoxin domain-containing protein n=1 Tax=Chitinibacter sp. S2-10 TaxID=3373597 RepID=UPI003977BB49